MAKPGGKRGSAMGTVFWWSPLLLTLVSAVQLQAQPPERACALSNGVGIGDGAHLSCPHTQRTVLDRPYCVHVPAPPTAGLPVVLLVHGYTSSGEELARYLDLDAAVERRRFILVKPNGRADSSGELYWQRAPMASGRDDVEYLTAVIDDVVKAFGADSSRVFVIGHSNGALMANRLACERSARIAAFVSLAGTVEASSCHPAQPVSVLTVHGTKDKYVLYEGGTLQGLGSYRSAAATLAFWAKADGCEGSRTAAKPLSIMCDNAPEAAVFSYEGCPPGIAVEHWMLAGVGHVPNFALPAWPNAVLDFLWAHPKPQK